MTFDHSGPKRFFPEAIESDDWTLFHGTSGGLEAEIERSGIRPNASVASEGMLDRAIAIFNTLNWMPPAGVPLKSFSKGFDLQFGTNPIFLAESSLRAAQYASRWNAGGEKISVLRRTIRQLREFCEDPEWREEVRIEQLRVYERAKKMNMRQEDLEKLRPKHIDIDWLQQSLQDIHDIEETAENAWRAHEYGVVYAVKFTPDAARHLRWHTSMGVISDGPIPSGLIIAKAKVTNEIDGEALREDPYSLKAYDKEIAKAIPRYVPPS